MASPAIKANGIIVEGNEVYENNYLKAQERPSSRRHRASRFGVTTNVTIRNNIVRNNYAKGIWVDHSLPTTIIEYNTVRDNAHQGIFSRRATLRKIRYNTSERNGGASATGYWLARAGIQITNSPGAEVHNNTVSYNANGITAMNTTGSAGLAAPLGPLKIQNLYVHDNVVRMSVGRSGVGQNTGEKQVYTSWNNRFVHNTYYTGAASTYFTWNELNLTRGAVARERARHDGLVLQVLACRTPNSRGQQARPGNGDLPSACRPRHLHRRFHHDTRAGLISAPAVQRRN